MAQKRINMIIQKEVLRLKGLGHSQRQIAKILGISRNTVGRYIDGPPPLPDLTPPKWSQEIDWGQLSKDIQKGKVPKKIIYEELCEAHKVNSTVVKKVPVCNGVNS